MTDRLTPGQLRDLSDLCAVGNRVVTLTANGETTRFYPNKDLAYVLREEAARREADPRKDNRPVDPMPPREGPGRAAASKRHCRENLHGALCIFDCGDGPCFLDKPARAAQPKPPTVAPDDEALLKQFGDTLYRFRKDPSSKNYDEMRAAEEALRRHIAGLRDELMAAEHTAGAEQLRREIAEAALADIRKEAETNQKWAFLEWRERAEKAEAALKACRNKTLNEVEASFLEKAAHYARQPYDELKREEECLRAAERVRALKKEPTNG